MSVAETGVGFSSPAKTDVKTLPAGHDIDFHRHLAPVKEGFLVYRPGLPMCYTKGSR